MQGLIGAPLVGHRLRVYRLHPGRKKLTPAAAGQRQGGKARLISYDLKDKTYRVQFDAPASAQHALHAGAPAATSMGMAVSDEEEPEGDEYTDLLAIHTETDWLLASDDEEPIPDEVVTKAVEVVEDVVHKKRGAAAGGATGRDSGGAAPLPIPSPAAAPSPAAPSPVALALRMPSMVVPLMTLSAAPSGGASAPSTPRSTHATAAAGAPAGSTAASSAAAAWKERQVRAFDAAVAAAAELAARAGLLSVAPGGVGALVGSAADPGKASTAAAALLASSHELVGPVLQPTSGVSAASHPLQQQLLQQAPGALPTPFIPAAHMAQPLPPRAPAPAPADLPASLPPSTRSRAATELNTPHAPGAQVYTARDAGMEASGGGGGQAGHVVVNGPAALHQAPGVEAVVQKGPGYAVLRTATGWEVLALVPGLGAHELSVVAHPDGRVCIDGRKEGANLNDCWGVPPIRHELTLPGPVQPAVSQVFLTLHGQLLVQLRDAEMPGPTALTS